MAYAEIDNTGGSDGDEVVRLYTCGDFEHALSGAAIASVGRPVFASADGTLTFTANANSYVGIVQDVPATGTIILRIDPNRRQVKTVTHAVEDLAANGDIAARAIHNFNQEGWITEARVVNQASAATGIDDSNTCVITLAIDAGTVVTETFDSTTTMFYTRKRSPCTPSSHGYPYDPGGSRLRADVGPLCLPITSQFAAR